MATFPSKGWCSQVHSRLASGDVTAPAELYKALFAPLVGWLASKRRAVERDLLLDAATDALVAYLKRPQAWDEAKSTLVSYICMVADRDLLNLMEKARRRQRYEVLKSDVEDAQQDRNVVLDDNETKQSLQEAVAALHNNIKSKQDLEFVAMMLSGERSTEKFAVLLGLGNETAEKKARLVKQHKDRLKKVLQRMKERQRAR
jgi:RNA polymerase sigma-70 factor, ECF subfamily